MKHKSAIKYPNIVAEMARRGETRQTIADLLGVTFMTVCRKLSGKGEWTISEVEALCEHYNMNYYELFK